MDSRRGWWRGKTILPVRARGCVVAKSPPQHRTRAGKPRKVTRKKTAKNAMPSASERPFQSFLSVRYSEVHWPSGWSLRTSPDQIARLQISRESVHRLFQARRLLAQSSQCQVLRPLALRRYISSRFSWVSSLFDWLARLPIAHAHWLRLLLLAPFQKALRSSTPGAEPAPDRGPAA